MFVIPCSHPIEKLYVLGMGMTLYVWYCSTPVQDIVPGLVNPQCPLSSRKDSQKVALLVNFLFLTLSGLHTFGSDFYVFFISSTINIIFMMTEAIENDDAEAG